MNNFDDRAYRNKPGWIYLIHAKGTNRYKIGLTTRSVEARLAELNSSQSPYPLVLVKAIQTENVTETESILHEKFGCLRQHGEWFEFNEREVRDVICEFDTVENGDSNLVVNLMQLMDERLSVKAKMILGFMLICFILGFVSRNTNPYRTQPLPVQTEQR